MILSVAVRDLMATELLTVGKHTTLQDAIKRLFEGRVSGLPVVDDDGKLVGIVTEQDCLRVGFQRDYYQQREPTVGEIMTTAVTTIEPNADIMVAVDVFLKASFRRLPVVEEGRLVGLLSRRDALRALMPQTSPSG